MSSKFKNKTITNGINNKSVLPPPRGYNFSTDKEYKATTPTEEYKINSFLLTTTESIDKKIVIVKRG